MDFFPDLINSLITAGGLGYINWFILTRLDKINISKDNKEEKVIFLILFSIINYGLFLMTLEALKYFSINQNFLIPTSILLVLIISIILSLTLFSSIATWINKNINIKRKKNQLSFYDSRSIKKLAFSFEDCKPIFIFNLDNDFIFSGQSGWISDLDGSDFELIIYPFNHEPQLNDYGKLMRHIEQTSVESEVYINIDKKVKIIILH